jgi:hypothetical protein
MQLITPMVITSQGGGNGMHLPVFAVLTLHFVPEPGLLLMLASGAIGLAIIGRNRFKP